MSENSESYFVRFVTPEEHEQIRAAKHHDMIRRAEAQSHAARWDQITDHDLDRLLGR